MFLYVFVLFFLLTPGTLFYFPKHKSKMITGLSHAFIFVIIWTFTHKYVDKITSNVSEGLTHKPNANSQGKVKPASNMQPKKQCPQKNIITHK